MDRPRHVAMTTKLWSTDKEWRPRADEDPLELFKLDSHGNQVLPIGHPQMVCPVFSLRQNYEEIERNIRRMKNFISHEQNEWWTKLFSDPEKVLSQPGIWFLDLMKPYEDEGHQEVSVNVESPLQFAMERERTGSRVYTGKHKSTPAQSITPKKQKKCVRESVGYMLAVEKEEELFVGKVTEVGRTTFEMMLYTGSLTGQWAPVELGEGRRISEVFPKEAIKEDMVFYLTPNEKLPAVMKAKFAPFLR